jgi:serine protease
MKHLTCVAALVAVLSPSALFAAAPASGLIVQLRDSADAAQDPRRQALQAPAAASAAPALPLAGTLGGPWHRVQADPAATADDTRALLARLRADPRVAAVLPDVREQRLAVTPNDTRFDSQWWLKIVGAGNTGAAGFASAWERSTGAAGSVAVAVLDSGITSHPEVNPRLLPGWDFVSDAVYANDGGGRDADPADPGDAITAADRSGNPTAFADCPAAPLSSWHGTTIAGQIAAVTDNGAGVAAAHWGALIVPVRVAGKCGAALSDIVDGLRWAAGLAVPGAPVNPNPARVIVLSYGGAESCNAASGDSATAAAARLYIDTIEEVRQAGAMVVVAAGNLRSAVGRPASCTGAFGVASLNREGYKATYSNFGAQIALATPGGDGDTRSTCDAQLADSGIVSTGNLGDVLPGAAGYVAASGTSFAAPAVAAAAALMLSVNPALEVEQLEEGLKRSARPHVKVPLLGNCSLTAPSKDRGRCACTTGTCGAGMLDAEQALLYAASPSTYVAPSRTAPTLDDARIRECALILGRPLPEQPEPEPEPEQPAADGGGGGAMSALWVLLLAVAMLTLLRRPRAAGRRHSR